MAGGIAAPLLAGFSLSALLAASTDRDPLDDEQSETKQERDADGEIVYVQKVGFDPAGLGRRPAAADAANAPTPRLQTVR